MSRQNTLARELRQRAVKEIVVHCSATKASTNYTALRLHRDHIKRGFSRIGYHFYLPREGGIVRGRELNEIGAHVKGHNQDSIGICLEGGLDEDGHAENNYTPEQWRELENLLKVLRSMFPGTEIKGHRDYPNVNKACPCFDVGSWVRNHLEKE